VRRQLRHEARQIGDQPFEGSLFRPHVTSDSKRRSGPGSPSLQSKAASKPSIPARASKNAFTHSSATPLAGRSARRRSISDARPAMRSSSWRKGSARPGPPPIHVASVSRGAIRAQLELLENPRALLRYCAKRAAGAVFRGENINGIAGWGGRIRTSEWRNQNPLPYLLATPQDGVRAIYRESAASANEAARRSFYWQFAGRSDKSPAVAGADPASGPRLAAPSGGAG
jgi:hypothetical protein